MQYAIVTKMGWKHVSSLDLIPKRIIDLMECREVEQMGICDGCPLAYKAHVLEPISQNSDTYRKLCPVLLHDAIKPDWNIEDLA